jgi:Trk-type K+ transport system membrane component
MLNRNKVLLAMATAIPSLPVLAQASDGNAIIRNLVNFLGSIGFGILALMVLIGLYCLFVFGTSLMKMGDENQREEVKPKTLVASMAGALVLTYGSYVLFVAMNTAFGSAPTTVDNAAFQDTASKNSTPSK